MHYIIKKKLFEVYRVLPIHKVLGNRCFAVSIYCTDICSICLVLRFTCLYLLCCVSSVYHMCLCLLLLNMLLCVRFLSPMFNLVLVAPGLCLYLCLSHLTLWLCCKYD